MCTRRQRVKSNQQFVCSTWVVGRTNVVANQDRDSWWREANLTLNHGNTRGINFRYWRINLKPRLPKYPTCVVTMGMNPETLLRSAKRTNVSTMYKLMPLGGWMGSNLIFQNSKGYTTRRIHGSGNGSWRGSRLHGGA
jgi:hypothetical protein